MYTTVCVPRHKKDGELTSKVCSASHCGAVSRRSAQGGDSTVPITASFGVTGFSPREGLETVTPELLLQQADTLLYEAKRRGRNRVEGRPLVR
ncbi:MAG: GGDEF domain-containing protein [Gammaproteobacteria bacterium]